MNKEITNKIYEIIELAIKASKDGNDIFLEYSPNVNRIYIRVYIGKWDDSKKPVLSFNVNIGEENSSQVLEAFIIAIKEIINQQHIVK